MPEKSSTLWPQPPSVPKLKSNDVHVWRIGVDLCSSAEEKGAPLLSIDEKERAQQMRVPEKRQQYVIGRASLRSILAAYSGTPCEQLAFDYGPQKKPSLARQEALPLDQRIHFNLSHSGQIVLIAVTLGTRIGIDVEYIEPERADENIARRYFSHAEFAALSDLPKGDRIGAFYRCWTSKEAFVKARGDGLSFALDAFDVAVGNEERAILEIRDADEDADRWELKAVDVGDQYTATCAVEGKALQWSQWSWPKEREDHAPA